MEEIKSFLIQLRVQADLEKIVKYHPASRVYLNNKTKECYTSLVEVYLFYTGSSKNPKILRESNYTEMMCSLLPREQNDTMPNTSHENNLLILVKNIIEIEWSYYQSYYQDSGEKNTKGLNHYADVTRILSDLLHLVNIRDNGSYKNMRSVFEMYDEREVLNGRKLTSFIPLGVSINSDQEKLLQIELLIKILRMRLLEPEYSQYPFWRKELLKWNAEQIQKAIDRMKQPFKDKHAFSLFRLSVIKSILSYLKGEMEWGTNAHMSTQQSQTIYLLLSMFGLLDKTYKRKTARDQSNYIQSLVTDIQRGKFFEFI